MKKMVVKAISGIAIPVFWNFCFFVCFKYAKQKLLVNKISYCDTVQTTGHLIITYLTHLGTINGTEVSYIHVVTVLHLSHQLSKICWILCYLKTKNKCQSIPDSVYVYSVPRQDNVLSSVFCCCLCSMSWIVKWLFY